MRIAALEKLQYEGGGPYSKLCIKNLSHKTNVRPRLQLEIRRERSKHQSKAKESFYCSRKQSAGNRSNLIWAAVSRLRKNSTAAPAASTAAPPQGEEGCSPSLLLVHCLSCLTEMIGQLPVTDHVVYKNVNP